MEKETAKAVSFCIISPSVKTEGFDGGRDMPRQRRGIRGDVGIAPYEIARRAEVKRREGQSPSPTDAQRGGGGETAGVS